MSVLNSLWISYAPDRYSKSWINKAVSWDDLCNRLTKPKVTAETFAEYRAMTKEAQADRKDVGGFVGGPISGGRRLARSVTCRTLITLDIDYATPGFWTEFTLKYRCAAFLYATHSSSPEKPRLRLIIPLSREVLPDQYEAVARRVGGDLDIEIIDPKSFEVQQLMYWPSVSSDMPYYSERQTGEPLDVDKVLARYRDWKDAAQWPMSSKVQEIVKREIAKQADPTTKTGVIGAFCRTYDIHKVIEEYLPDIYVKTQHENRYTYVKGSTAAGLVVHDGGIFAYTHHQTDPIGRNLCNAFDLVRLHLFGALDADVDPHTPITKRPSFMAMREEALNDEDVRFTMSVEQLNDALSAFGDWTEEEKAFLKELKRDKQGNILGSIDNCVKILNCDPGIKDLFILDEFRNEDAVNGSLPWRTDAKQYDMIEDKDFHALYAYFEKYGITNRSSIDTAVQNILLQNRRHPVREYLRSLTWDKKPRLDRLLVDFFGVEDTPYCRAVSRKTFVAAVARVFCPGIKFDTMLVLVSEEGTGKSTFVTKMGIHDDWVKTGLAILENQKAALEQIQGKWLIEIAELAAFKKSDTETIKSFISTPTDHFRKAYAKLTKSYPRQCIFIGTTNETDFLTDPGKNRRFWPVKVRQEFATKSIWDDLIPQEVSQLWAEACHYYDAGEELHLDLLTELEAQVQREAYREQDPRYDLIQRYLDCNIPANWAEMDRYERLEYMNSETRQSIEGTGLRDRASVMEIWTEVFGKREADAKNWDVKFIRNYIENRPDWEARVVKIGGYSVRGYIRKTGYKIER